MAIMFDHKLVLISILLLNLSTTRSSKTPPSSSKILYDKDADPRDFPFIVAILHPDAEKGVADKSLLIGSGSILADKWIITSKLVVMDFDKNPPAERPLAIYPKYDTDLSSLITKKPKSYKVDKAFCAPKISSDWKDSQSNLALIKLTESIPLDKGPEHFRSIPASEGKRWKLKFRTAGWGETKSRDPSTKMGKLQVADMALFDSGCSPSCRIMSRLGGLYGNNVCFGDDGGPATLKDGDKPEELVGVIVDMDKRCWYDSTFINITTFKPWIMEVMKDEPEKYDCKTHPR